MLLVLFVMAAFAHAQGTTTLFQACQAEAVHEIDEFCYRTSVAVTRTASGNLTDYPIAVPMRGIAFEDQGLIRSYGWDFLPVDAGNSEIQGLIQDIEAGSASSTTWWLFGDVTGGTATTNFQIYTGFADHQRDQGMGFDTQCGALSAPCDDYVTVTDHADLDFTDDFDLVVRVQTDTPDQDGDLIDKIGGGVSYSLTVSSTSTGAIVFTVGTSTLEYLWDGALTTFRARFDNSNSTDMALYTKATDDTWTLVASQNSPYESIGANSVDVRIGEGFDGTIYTVELNGAAGFGRTTMFEFAPTELTETQAGTTANGYIYTGTVDDVAGSHNGTYTFERDQDVFSNVTVAPTAFNFSDPALQVTPVPSDVFGALGGGDFAATSTAFQSLGLFGDVLTTAAGSTSFTQSAFMFMFLTIVGGLLAIMFFMMSRSETVFAVVLVTVYGIGASVGMIDRWWAVLAGLTIFTLWLLLSRERVTA